MTRYRTSPRPGAFGCENEPMNQSQSGKTIGDIGEFGLIDLMRAQLGTTATSCSVRATMPRTSRPTTAPTSCRPICSSRAGTSGATGPRPPTSAARPRREPLGHQRDGRCRDGAHGRLRRARRPAGVVGARDGRRRSRPSAPWSARTSSAATVTPSDQIVIAVTAMGDAARPVTRRAPGRRRRRVRRRPGAGRRRVLAR